MTNELWRLDGTAIASGIRNGDFSARDAVSSCLERLDEVNPGLNAIVESRPDEALAAADTADEAVADGAELGALHGVPVSIKANQDLAGWATVNGCAAWKDNIAPASSPAVQNWLDAGVIVIGRTNTPEFSCRWETTNDFYGATGNPWNADITPGGSSGGAASSVAAGINPMSTGTDLGGSLRQPAQACGVASMRPGQGRVPDWNPTDPTDPGIGFQLMNVNGHIARSVRDLRLGLDAMIPGDWHDPAWTPAPLEDSVPTPHRIALVTDPGGTPMSDQVLSGVRKAGELLANAGYEVDEVTPPVLGPAKEIWQAICIGELIMFLEPAVRDFCGPRMTKCFEFYRHLLPDGPDPVAILHALSRRKTLLRDWLEFTNTYPLVVGPVSTQPPLPRDADLESPEKTLEIVDCYRLTATVNALNLPAVTVPVGISDGLPQAVQVVGPHFAELRCLAAARAIEDQAGPLTPIDPK